MQRCKTILLLLLLSTLLGCRTQRSAQEAQTEMRQTATARCDSTHWTTTSQSEEQSKEVVTVQISTEEFDLTPDGTPYLKRRTTTTTERGTTHQSTAASESSIAQTSHTKADTTTVSQQASESKFAQKPDGGIAFNFGFALAMIIVVALLILITQQ